MGFGTPINLWLNTELKESSSELLKKLEKRKYLMNPRFVKTINKNRLKLLYSYTAWRLIMFELWYETFIENNNLKPINI